MWQRRPAHDTIDIDVGGYRVVSSSDGAALLGFLPRQSQAEAVA